MNGSNGAEKASIQTQRVDTREQNGDGGDMIKRCRNAGLEEPEFALTDGFVATIRRNPERAFEAVGGEITGEIKSRPESLEMRVLGHLATAPLSKAALSAVLGHKEISGQLNKVIRVLLGDQTNPPPQALHRWVSGRTRRR